MPLSPGERLGPYEILSPIGAGGMGEVFRATDTRLHRTVAIKILPHDKIGDPNRKLRFLQEARAASALNHPNIVTLHDFAPREQPRLSGDGICARQVTGQANHAQRTAAGRGTRLGDADRERWRRRMRLESCIGISSRGT
jgi:hypothetical protein